MTTAIAVRTAHTLPSFAFNEKPLRVILIDGEPWFVAVDVCNAIGIENARMAVQKLDEDERMQVIDSNTVNSTDGTQINNLLNVVSESGMNALVLRCRDAMTPGTVAHQYRKWVTAEVLPSIRKTGSYSLKQEQQPAPRYITNHQYQQLRNKIGDLAARTLNSNSAESYLWNKLRFELNLENSTKLPADQFEQAEALVNAMQKTYFAKGGVHEFLRELSTHLLREHVCEGVPLTNDLRNHWRKQTGLVLPQPLNWKALALKQDQLEHAA